MSEDIKNLVKIEYDNGVAWVSFNRPEKRNAMTPKLADRMLEVLDEVEVRQDVGVMVLTGEGSAFSAGMDIKEYFRDMKGKPHIEEIRARRKNWEWQWKRLRYFEKATIAMVNGWCCGGAFLPMASCDLAIAADDAKFVLSEINWGILPAGNVTKSMAALIPARHGIYCAMTGLPFDGKQAAEWSLVNESVPLADLKKRTRELANILLEKNPVVLKACKEVFKRTLDHNLGWDISEEYLIAKQEQLWMLAGEEREKGFKQFLDDKSYKPGMGMYKKDN